MEYSDKAIFDEIYAGNREHVLRYLYTSFYPKMEQYIRGRGGDPEDARDIFQDSVLIFYRKVLEQKISENQYTVAQFIMGVGRNMWVDKMRKQKVVREHTDHVRTAFYSDRDWIEIQPETTELVAKVIGSLGKKCQDILTRVLFRNMSTADIAEELGYKSADSVKTSHFRCRQKLIKKYSGNQRLKEMLAGE
jgi:RNA polymerase sigma factor (sigma-70 family)